MNMAERTIQDYSPHGLHKFKYYYEDLKEYENVHRKITIPDRVWDWADSRATNLVSAGRYLYRAFRRLRFFK